MDSDDGDSDDYLGSLEVHNMDNKDRTIWVTPEVQGRMIKMELDTGSAVSVLPYKQYKERFGHVKLAKSGITLKTYTGEKITPKGEMKCNAKFKGQEKELTLQVVETPGPALFGHDWLSKIQLDWGEIKALKLIKTPKGGMQRKVDQLLQKYESVFSEGVGTLKGHKADLKVEENCPPSFHKPCKFHTHFAPVRLACDASSTGIGAVLSHVMPYGSERPVTFASWSLTKTECKYAQIGKEALSNCVGC